MCLCQRVRCLLADRLVMLIRLVCLPCNRKGSEKQGVSN